MKRKSMIVAVLLAGMVLGACGKKNETSVIEDPVVSEAPTEEAAAESEETTGETDQSAGETEESAKENETTAADNAGASETTKNSSSGNSNADTSDSTAAESTDTQSEQNTGVQAKYQMYAGTYFDEILYSYAAEDNDAEVAPYCEIEVSNVTSTSFDFTIYDVDGVNRSLKFKTHTAVFTGDGTQAEYNGKGYHLVFTFPDDRGALPDVVCMQVSGLKDMGGCMYVNNGVPGHEFG